MRKRTIKIEIDSCCYCPDVENKGVEGWAMLFCTKKEREIIKFGIPNWCPRLKEQNK